MMVKSLKDKIMGKKESLQKKIDFIDSQLRFFRNALLAILSALTWTIYAINGA